MSVDLSEFDWKRYQSLWSLRPDTVYLNHGSFGPPPEPVRRARAVWQEAMDRQPMDFFVRQLDPAWHAARERMARFVGAAAENLIFVDNATVGMNIVANSFRLGSGDEVLLTDHEYGAVRRTWQRACDDAGAVMKEVALPCPLDHERAIVDAIGNALSPRTRLVVVSHITSPTAVILPVAAICRMLRERGVAVCIDGPHAVAQAPLALDELGCDFYTASGHKWLSAPFGSGFLYVAPQHQATIQPLVMSWGRLLPAMPEKWFEQFIWSGTGDISAWLAMPAAIDLLEEIGWETFRRQTHALAQYARERLMQLTSEQPLTPDSPTWYGSMALVPLPPGQSRGLQNPLWRQYGIEAPIVTWRDRRFLRVSCHLYNEPAHIDRLAEAVERLLAAEK